MSSYRLTSHASFSIYGVGLKTALVLEALGKDLQPERVFTYEVSGEHPSTLERLRHAAKDRCHVLRRGEIPPIPGTDLTFTIGWQFRLESFDSLVVLHDSLLPKFRGFAPTVSALIMGDTELGVTAIRPISELDAGPILSQHSVAIAHPLKVQQAFQLLAPCYVNCIRESVRKFGHPSFLGVPQQSLGATYSIWRDETDLEINWYTSAEQIARFVAAVSYPYSGARTMCDGRRIIVDDVEVLADLPFVNRTPGKIWQRKSEHQVDVLCGTGMLRITSARNEDGSAFTFQHVRRRLGSRG